MRQQRGSRGMQDPAEAGVRARRCEELGLGKAFVFARRMGPPVPAAWEALMWLNVIAARASTRLAAIVGRVDARSVQPSVEQAAGIRDL